MDGEESNQNNNSSCCGKSRQGCYSCPKMMRHGFEKFFGALGRTVARFPWITIAVCLIIGGTCAVGFMFIKIENRVEKLYIPPDSVSTKDLDSASKYFGLNAKQEQMIFLPRSGSNILTRECFVEMLQLHNAITGLKDYQNFCYKGRNKMCMFLNPVEVFSFDANKMYNISDTITKVYNSPAIVMRNGRPLVMSFGGVVVNPVWSNGTLQSAAAIQVFYLVSGDPDKYEGLNKWEDTLIKKVFGMRSSLKSVKVYLSASRSLSDAIAASSGSDVSLLSISFVLMIIFACVSQVKFRNPLTGHSLLASVGILAVCLGIVAGHGLAMFTGTPYISIVGILPFLILGIGIDDMFIIIDELDRTDISKYSVLETVELVMAHSGASITMTTLTDLVAFAVSTSTVFPSIRYFCIYAALTITFAYLMVVTFFVAFVSFDVRRMKAGRRDFFPICRVPPEKEGKPSWTTPYRPVSSNIMKAWGKVLMLTPVRVIVVLISCCLLGVSIFYALKISESFDRRLLAKEGTYILDFLNTQEKYYGHSFQVSMVIDSKIDYSTSEVQAKLLKIPKIATDNPYYKNRTISWMAWFKSFSQKAKLNTTGSSFIPSLKTFLAIPAFSHFKQDVIFSKDNSIVVASRMLCIMESTMSSVRQRDAMLTLRRDLASKSDLPVYAISKIFIYLEQYVHTKSETTHNVAVAGAAVFVIVLPFLQSFTATILVCLGFGALICELFALMYVWGVSLNMVSTINIVMAIGFTVDYSAHIAHAYGLSTERKPEDRVIHALSTVGASVLMGGASTFLGMVVTAFASSEVFRIFFKMFLGIVVLGLLHGLCFLPVYLSILCRCAPVKHVNSGRGRSKPSCSGRDNASSDKTLELVATECAINKHVQPIFSAHASDVSKGGIPLP